MAFSRSVHLIAVLLCMVWHNPAAATTKSYLFNGKIVDVNAKARSFTLSGDGKPYLFHVTPATRVTWGRKALTFADLKAGQDAEVEMTPDSSGKGIATAVRLASPWTAKFTSAPTALSETMAESLWAATTPSGKRLSAHEIKPLVLASSWPKAGVEVMGYVRIRLGVFLLTVRSDGSVEKVEVLQSVGHKMADHQMIETFRKWRFRPNSVREVRIPSQYRLSR